MMKFMLALLFLFESAAFASTLRSSEGKVTFLAKGNPGFMKIEGSSGNSSPQGELQVSPQEITGTFTFNLKSLETGIDLRDEHMKEKYLEVEKFPEAKLVLNPIKPGGSDLKKLSGKFSGMLTLHGVTKEVTGEYRFTGDLVNATFPIKVSDYAIDIPSWMGVTVTDTVDVTVETNLK